MSRESCQLLHDAGYPSDDINNLRTVDLEIFNFRTGLQIGGDCEMRVAWTFNILDPRAYYCIGGDQYWSSRYMKRISMIFMNSNPLTHVVRRRTPFDFTYASLPSNWYMTLWDLSNFTSTLSELRYFLWYAARYLEDFPQTSMDKIVTFDYHHGLVELSISELLDQYNSHANMFPSFSIYRILDKLMLQDEVDEVTSMVAENSGLLGVQGNIGLSTTLHGIVTLGACGDPDCGTCVGDDAYAYTEEPPEESLVPMIQRLGNIQPSKFDISEPFEPAYEEFRSKFLKRPLHRDYDGLHHEFAFTFPILAYAFDAVPPERTIHGDLSLSDRAHKFITQTGAFLWELHDHSEYATDETVDIALKILRSAYQALSLPFAGALPGTVHLRDGTQIHMTVPPVLVTNLFDPRLSDWAEYVWDSNLAPFITIPMTTESPFVLPRGAEGEVLLTMNGFIGVLEDIGYLKKVGLVYETVDASLADNRRVFLQLVHGENRKVYKYLCTPFEISWFDEVYDRMYSDGPPVAGANDLGVYTRL
jgi:hypothetical protein